MSVRILPVNQCIAGDCLAEDIWNEQGAVVVTANTLLNDYIIGKLADMGIETLKLHIEENGKDENAVALFHESFRQSYRKNILHLKELLNALAAGEAVDICKLNLIAGSIYEEISKNRDIVSALSRMRDKDEYTYRHSIHVSFYSMLIAKWLGYSEKETKEVIQTGLLHDVGKIKVPISILNKPGRLEPQEFEEIKKHTCYGYELIKNCPEISSEVKYGVLMHHERMDGSGYPSGISGSAVSRYAKIIAVADVFDAMTTKRIYKGRCTPIEAFDMFQTLGIGIFDTEVLYAFLNNIAVHYVGAKVRLNTGEMGEIVYLPPHSLTEPIVKTGEKYIDFSTETEYAILDWDCFSPV